MEKLRDFEELVKIAERLRKECPWDRKQTIKTMLNDISSEAEEVKNAIEKGDIKNLEEELGDLLWSIILTTQIAKDDNLFTIEDVLREVKEKMIRRHPHVFGDLKAETPEDAIRFFNEVKKREKSKI